MSKGDRPIVISMSGPDGSGKSTQIELLEEFLNERGYETEVIWMRLGYTPGFSAAKGFLRRILGKRLPTPGASSGRKKMMANSSVRNLWLMGAVVDFVITTSLVVRLESYRGKSVICDRWVWDSLVDRRLYYPGAKWADRLLERGFQYLGREPDHRILLNLSFEEASRRCEAKNEPFPDAPALRAKRHLAYDELSKSSAFEVIDAMAPVEKIADKIRNVIRP